MGGYGPMIAQAGVQGEQNELARQHTLQDEQRQQLLQRNWGILNDPNADPTLKQQAGQSITGLYPTPAHAPTFLSDILHLRMKKAILDHNAQAQQGAPSAVPAPSAPSSQNGPPQMPSDDSAGTDPTAAAQGGGSPNPNPSPAPTPSATPSATPASPPPPDMSTIRAVGSAATPQDALNLWRQYRGPVAINEDIAKQRAQAAATAAQSLADKNNAARILEAQIRVHGNASQEKLDAAAQSLGAPDFASADPDTKIKAMQALKATTVTPTWKSVVDGNSIFAVDAHDPSKRQLIGHRDDLSSSLQWKTMTNADGSTYEVPFTVWTKKGSSQPVMETQGEPGAAPISSNTPQGVPGAVPSQPTSATPSAPVSTNTPNGPSNPGARAPGTKPSGGAQKNTATKAAPVTSAPSGLPKGAIPFGSKPSELLKSDTQQYTKLAEDANGAKEALVTARAAARSPSPTSDQELIYSWVRSNVQGAGRMTQAEFSQASRVGSLPQKAQNWFSLATSGKMTPEIRQMMLADIERGAGTKQQIANELRGQVQQEMTPNTPKSSKTPSGPGSSSDDDLVKRLNQALTGGK